MTRSLEHRQILDGVAEGVIAAGASGTIVYANRALEQMLGYRAGELLGRPLSAIIPVPLREAYQAEVERSLATPPPPGTAGPRWVRVQREDGNEVEVEMTIGVLGEGELTLASLREDRERVEVERLRVDDYLRAALRVAPKLTAAQQVEDAIDAVAQMLRSSFDASRVEVWLADETPSTLRLGGVREDPVPPEVLEVVRHERRLCVSEGGVPRTSGVALPLASSGAVRGVLRCSIPAPIAEVAMEVLETLAELLGSVLHTLRTAERQRSAAQRMTRLQAVTAGLSKALTQAQVMDVIVEQGLTFSGASTGYTALLSDDGACLEIRRQMGPVAGTDPAIAVDAEQPAAEALRTGVAIFLESHDAKQALFPEWQSPFATAHHAWAFVPLVAQEVPLGAIVVAFAEPHAFDEDERSFLLALSRLCAQALERCRLYEERTDLLKREREARADAEMDRAELHALFAEAPVAIAVQRGPSHVYERANPLYCQLVGDPRPHGKAAREVLPAQARLHRIVDRAYKSGETFVGKEVAFKVDLDGTGKLEEAVFNFIVQPLRKPGGLVDGVITFGIDVTEQVLARMKIEVFASDLSNQQKWLEAALDGMPTPLVLIEPGTARVTFANKAADALAGGLFPKAHSASEYERLYPCTNARGHRIGNDEMPGVRAARGEKLVGLELEWQTPAGRVALAASSEHLPAMFGHPPTVLLSLLDITRRKRIEQELSRTLHLREEILATASHELRTPLTALQLQLHSLRHRISGARGDLVTERLLDKTDGAVRQSERLAQLIEHLLDLPRLTGGRFDLAVEDFNFADEVRDVTQRFTRELERAHCDVELSAHGETRGRWDRTRMSGVVTQLLRNAIHHGAERPIELRVTGAQDRVIFSIRDHGVGIPEEKQAKLFERAALGPTEGRAQLGLWMAHEITRAHGGSLRVESRPGAGATFTLELPRLVETSERA